MITIDGSYGEGGGQILRTSASLAAITGQPVRIERIRAGRAQPGLKAQHLTAIGAAMRICNGHIEGGGVGATEVTLTPGSPVQPGRYEFDIGTAGSTSLVLQTVMLPLLLAGEESGVTIVGGTHNTNAPTSDYLGHTFLRAAGVPVEMVVERVGFFPRGGGKVSATFRPAPLTPIRLTERGARTLLTVIVTVSDTLPPHILERAGAEIRRRAEAAGRPLRLVLAPVPSLSPGMAVHLDRPTRSVPAASPASAEKGCPPSEWSRRPGASSRRSTRPAHRWTSTWRTNSFCPRFLRMARASTARAASWSTFGPWPGLCRSSESVTSPSTRPRASCVSGLPRTRDPRAAHPQRDKG